MADDVTFQSATLATPPATTKVATDDVGGSHYQRMKLVDGTDGSTTAAKVTAQGAVEVAGDVAHDSPDAGLPIKVGGKVADINTAFPTPVSAGDRVDGFFGPHGEQMVGLVDAYGSEVGLLIEDGAAWVEPRATGGILITEAGPIRAIRTYPVDGDGNSAMDDANNALRVNVVSGGAGTQYTEGDTDASITGTAVMWEDGAETLRAVSAAKPLPVGDAGGSLTVDASSLPLPTGAATSALQTQPGVDIGDVTVNNAAGASAVNIQDGGNSITVDGTVTANLAAGTNNIGDVDVLSIAAGNNNIGDVDVASIAAGDNNIGNVDIVTMPAVTVTGVSTLAEQQTQTTHLATIAGDTTDIETAIELIDDTVHTDDAARGKSLLIGAVLDDTAPTSVTENQAGYLRMSSARRLLVDGSGVTQPVSGTVTVTEPVSVDDNAGSLTVDAADGTVFVRSSAAATFPVNVGRVSGNVTSVGSGTVDTGTQRVILATDQPVIPVSDNGGSLTVDGTVSVAKAGTGTTTQVADTASSTTLLALNANRLGASIVNDSSARLYIKAGTTASSTDYTVSLLQHDVWEVPAGYTGRIDGIWATDPGDGAARVTEYT